MNPIDTSALESAIEQKQPTKKMSLIRQLMPKINEAMARGLSKKEIWESLSEAGLEIGYKMFVTYLSRIEPSNKAPEPKHEANFSTEVERDQGPSSTHSALDKARRHAAGTDYSKVMRNRSNKDKK
jgi:hypothetical protein